MIYKVGTAVPKVLLTPTFARSASCPEGAKRIDYFDRKLPGFMLEVRASGGKTFYQRYRDDHGRERQFKIGPAGVLSVSQARGKARAILAGAMLGDDPQKKREQLRKIPTFSEFIRDFYLPFVKKVKRSWRTDETILRLHIQPKIGRHPIDQITSQMIADLVSGMRNHGYASGTTNRVLILTRFVFNLAIKWGSPGATKNPTSGLSIASETYRERFLTAEEAKQLFAAIDADPNQTAARAIKLLLLTGARRNEITYAKWEYVDWERRTLLVPLSKSGRSRLIQLNTAALEVLRSIPRDGGNVFICPSPLTGRPSASLHFPWSRIRKRAKLSDVRLHDLRHSFASFLVNNGISLYVVQGLLGHANTRATQRYAHLANATLSDAAEVMRAVVLPSSLADAPIFNQQGAMAVPIYNTAGNNHLEPRPG
jgi:integrase